jgi:siroheme synthase-like protein
MGYYPVVLELSGRRCVVLGGGAVAERKVEGLVEACANIKVISPTITTGLQRFVDDNKILHEKRSYLPGDLAGYQLAFVATDDAEINATVYKEGRDRGVWVNAADDPAHCDFILPSVLRRGELAVAVSTGGKSPALARSIREELEPHFTADHASLVELAAEVREELRRLSLSPGYEKWRSALNSAVRQHIRGGEITQARKLLLKALGAMQCT